MTPTISELYARIMPLSTWLTIAGTDSGAIPGRRLFLGIHESGARGGCSRTADPGHPCSEGKPTPGRNLLQDIHEFGGAIPGHPRIWGEGWLFLDAHGPRENLLQDIHEFGAGLFLDIHGSGEGYSWTPMNLGPMAIPGHPRSEVNPGQPCLEAGFEQP